MAQVAHRHRAHRLRARCHLALCGSPPLRRAEAWGWFFAGHAHWLATRTRSCKQVGVHLCGAGNGADGRGERRKRTAPPSDIGGTDGLSLARMSPRRRGTQRTLALSARIEARRAVLSARFGGRCAAIEASRVQLCSRKRHWAGRCGIALGNVTPVCSLLFAERTLR